MQKTYCRWSDEEIKQLFSFIETQTSKGQTRAKAFALYAQSCSPRRKPNSVRNYYYLELEHLQNNPSVAKILGIKIDAHQKQTPNYFSDKEATKVIEDIEKLVKEGNSVRKACLILSNGNIEQMVRLQNKYRSLKKESQTSKKEEKAIFSNIISMPQKPKGLTEQEINSLFLGLLKLIKASAKQESLNEYTKKTQDANYQLRKALVSLNEKEKELKKLRDNFELLKQENSQAKKTITSLRAETAALIAGNKKMQALKNYTKVLKTIKAKKQTN